MSAAAAGKKFFDTNVLVYLHAADVPAKRLRAHEVFESALAADAVVLSVQVLQEFFVAATRRSKTPLSVDEAEAQVRRYARLELVLPDAELVLAAIARAKRSKISFWDALVVEAALRAGCTVLFTEDLQEGWVVDGRLTVVNPFA
jgi:predicted nucleic acid-binding protein